MAVIDISSHLDSLEHSQIADLVGDARVIELLSSISKQRDRRIARGDLLLEALGGLDGLLQDRAKLRALFLTFSQEQEQELARFIGVDDLFSFRLTSRRRNAFYRAFGADPPSVSSDVTPHFATPVEVNYGLFPHQTDVLLRASPLLDPNGGRAMVHMPTGAGKTRTAMHLICRHLNSHKAGLVLWMVSGIELCEQAAREFENAWGFLGERPLPLIRLWGGLRTVDSPAFARVAEETLRDLPGPALCQDRWPAALRDGVIIASMETLLEMLDTWEPREILQRSGHISLTVFDEAHRALAPSYNRAISAFSSRSGLLGLSATPGRRHHLGAGEDDLALAELFDQEKVVLKIPGFESPVEGLIDLGYLARLDKEALPVVNRNMTGEDIAKVRRRLSRSLDLDEDTLASFGLDATRNLEIVSRIETLIDHDGHHRILVFCPSVLSSELISNILMSRGIPAGSVTARTPSNRRQELFDQFRSRPDKPMVLCNFAVLTTGFDAPQTSAVVIARPTSSIVLLSQMAGRATRGPRVGGTERATLVTVVDTTIPELSDVVEQFHAFDDAWQPTP